MIPLPEGPTKADGQTNKALPTTEEIIMDTLHITTPADLVSLIGHSL
ncbi:hypothetical protein [Pseudarthrobacter sulfonivorans]|nr:hypothetical protein [Pseudarthrobacter sulfonivorans]